jgi:hypothetical protein
VAVLDRLAAAHGERFTPTKQLREMGQAARPSIARLAPRGGINRLTIPPPLDRSSRNIREDLLL